MERVAGKTITRGLPSPRANTFERVGEENASADQTHKSCYRLKHRKRPLRPCTDKTTRRPAQSKGFADMDTQSGPSGDSAQQVCQERATNPAARGHFIRKLTASEPLIHHG
jgi:hypothetical protein